MLCKNKTKKVDPTLDRQRISLALTNKNNNCPSSTLQVKYEIGRECPTCLRGAIATEDISKDQLLISVPLSLGILLPRIERRAFASEYAHGLILKFKTDPIFNKTHSLFWSTQPKAEEILSADVFPNHLIKKLQTPELERLITSQRQVATNVYYGRTRWADYAPIPDILTGENAVSLPEFLYVSGIVGTRDFALTDESVDDDVESTPFWLIPVADMVNHADAPNARRSDNGTHVFMHALRCIKKGEAVTNDYQTNVLDRNDMALHIYGTFLGYVRTVIEIVFYRKCRQQCMHACKKSNFLYYIFLLCFLQSFRFHSRGEL